MHIFKTIYCNNNKLYDLLEQKTFDDPLSLGSSVSYCIAIFLGHYDCAHSSIISGCTYNWWVLSGVLS